MASSFRIKLKLPPNAGGGVSSEQNSPSRSSQLEGSSMADDASSMMTDEGEGEF